MRLARGTPRWLVLLWLLPLLPRAAWRRVALAGLAVGCTCFFRDPERRGPTTGILAPADGRIRDIQVRSDGRWVVSTYLSLRDVHVTRAPYDATVLEQQHRSGSYRPAFHRSSDGNERVAWSLTTPAGPLELVQYAGSLARRIVPYVGVHDQVRRGQRIGLIRFGSRVDVVLPPGAAPGVGLGDRVKGGATVIAAAASGVRS